MIAPLLLFLSVLFPLPEATLKDAFASRKGGLVFIDCATGEKQFYNPRECQKPLAPCSTFKIWNTAIGLETGILTRADAPFYKWDGVKRFIPAWNADLTLREAFQASCVPAYQELARKIGPERMQSWIDRLDYGNRDTASGIDLFWLPEPGRKTILISAGEQAALLSQLVKGELPFKPGTLAVLKEVMFIHKADYGTLYGKTGTGGKNGVYNLGWFVGYVENGGRTYAFACVLEGEKVMGTDARAIVEKMLAARFPASAQP